MAFAVSTLTAILFFIELRILFIWDTSVFYIVFFTHMIHKVLHAAHLLTGILSWNGYLRLGLSLALRKSLMVGGHDSTV
jgi:hypothetical protein